MRAADAIISRPQRVPRLRRGLFGAITLAAWSVFVWLLTPVLTLVAWLLGLGVAYDTTVGRFGRPDPVLLLALLATSALGGTLLLAWAELQRRRFTGVERRQRAADATPAEIAAFLGADPATAQALRSGRIVSLAMREDGSPAAATVRRIPRPRRPVDGHDPDGHDPDGRSGGPTAVGSGTPNA